MTTFNGIHSCRSDQRSHPLILDEPYDNGDGGSVRGGDPPSGPPTRYKSRSHAETNDTGDGGISSPGCDSDDDVGSTVGKVDIIECNIQNAHFAHKGFRLPFLDEPHDSSDCGRERKSITIPFIRPKTQEPSDSGDDSKRKIEITECNSKQPCVSHGTSHHFSYDEAYDSGDVSGGGIWGGGGDGPPNRPKPASSKLHNRPVSEKSHFAPLRDEAYNSGDVGGSGVNSGGGGTSCARSWHGTMPSLKSHEKSEFDLVAGEAYESGDGGNGGDGSYGVAGADDELGYRPPFYQLAKTLSPSCIHDKGYIIGDPDYDARLMEVLMLEDCGYDGDVDG
jgi:hypothetical protein